MKPGVYIRIKGRHRNPGSPFSKGPQSDYGVLVIELKPEESMFSCLVMKEDGTLWNVYEKQIIFSL